MAEHVIITGASTGIGAALARELANRGYAVGLIARSEDKLASLAQELGARGASVAFASADVRDREAVFQAVARLEDALGPVDRLVANAGIGGALRPEKGWDHVEVRRTFEVNLFGAAHAAEAALEGMRERKRGQLVLISSVAATRGLPGTGPYSASKAAASTLWESMRPSLRKIGVDCLTVHPGFVRTPLTDKNSFKMPFILEPEDAARRIVRAMEARRRFLTFPLPMVVLQWLMKRLPNWLFDALMGGAG
ncbi:MAG: SDR family NAD(P)-dependent oxidoreductase [Myxococcota bacterium]|nr:SDR family NAD(P)-dependent oxidoreductase [Myxococcota bacterium]